VTRRRRPATAMKKAFRESADYLQQLREEFEALAREHKRLQEIPGDRTATAAHRARARSFNECLRTFLAGHVSRRETIH
jgi:hypothetical protein